MQGRTCYLVLAAILGTFCVLCPVVADLKMDQARAETAHQTLASSVMRGAVKDLVPFGQSVTVKFGLVILRAELDTSQRTLTVHCWLKYNWNDFRLSWDPSRNINISSLNLAPDKVWKPDITLYSKVAMDMEETMVVVMSDGTVFWVPPVRVVVDCTQDGDTYKCPFKFGSWTYDSSKSDIAFFGDEEADVSEYNSRGMVEILEAPGVRSENTYPCCPGDVYPDITFNVVVRPIGDGQQSTGNSGHYFNHMWLLFIAILSVIIF